ncbi:hypothetical protein DO97_10215 [Neosynechococcus sphagnicola sy1]|uniref:Uncharacterized protein n=1 Tax=Neosynechococcus sphagnicola sy1 TaxID=1497020 RepID=A0A098TNA7_9CYAN|nr:hypothetical protein [Neosynechococcus sphagnicola]KGF73779.1 hypothetical protein DO97_10215 [Neosynechococcus sphagnicola sy1]
MLLELTITEIGQRAIAFLVDDLEIPTDDRDWFSVLTVRPVGETWHVVEVGVEGLPDKWVLQVYDTGECDPSYTFSSPVNVTETDTGLQDLPEAIAQILATERISR